MRIATTSDIGHWFRNDWFFQGERCKAVGADDSVCPVHSFSRLGATHIKKALCYDAGIIAKGFFILDCAYLTSSMMAVSAASPRRTPVRTMRV